jgi:hypothetical protein
MHLYIVHACVFVLGSKLTWKKRSLVDLVVIDAEFGRKNYGLITCNCNREGVETTWFQNWPPKPDSTGDENQIKKS